MDTAKARKHMVDSQVRPNDVPSLELQQAMLDIPRERFVPADRKTRAYVEQDIELFEGRWLLKARDFAKLVNAANIQPCDLILDVGFGYGYSSAVLAQLGDVVVAIEDDPSQVDAATDRWNALGVENAVAIEADLSAGYAKQAPYDVIVVAGGVQQGLETLLGQLKEDVGRLVTIDVQDRVGTAKIYTRSGNAL
ncbi:MAG: protein-L-isoaspartate O-methyltransferase, partial [Parvularculaceae bacterium]|nr:protein-L-isoaspartate O-methyltransferase [Parvularculaceae bacterium]